MKKKIIISGIGLFVVLLVVAFSLITSDLSSVRDVQLNGIDVTALVDGRYVGTFERGRFTNTLIVHIENNAIVGIEIEDDVLAAWITNASGEVFRRVIEAQDTQIDAVSGATVTTNAYLRAIENALAN